MIAHASQLSIMHSKHAHDVELVRHGPGSTSAKGDMPAVCHKASRQVQEHRSFCKHDRHIKVR